MNSSDPLTWNVDDVSLWLHNFISNDDIVNDFKPADNLAAHEVAGFQETFSSGHFCRRCLISYENRLASLADIDFIPRVNVKHQYYLQLKSKHLRRKSIFGEAGPSPFDEVINFDPTKFFPGDLMHDFFEDNY
ncbi:unnamed protein product [Rotaria sp. Silwood2]|nr:unnamed protein product [Rotaria sp. Silwood2]CAF4345014.1 unnamed protein product [Rotaria sp. Silwood2]